MKPFFKIVLGVWVIAMGSIQAHGVSIEKIQSPGGISAWLSPDKTSPVVSMVFSFRGGAAHNDAGQEGLASLAVSLLDEGAGSRNGEQFHVALQENAISLGFGVDRDRVTGVLRFPLSSKETALGLLKDVLYRPHLKQTSLDKNRGEMLINLGNIQKTPGYKAGRLLAMTLFPDHPYGRPEQGTTDSLKSLALKDVKGFLTNAFSRQDLTIGVCGDIDASGLATVVDDVFMGLPQKSSFSPILRAKPLEKGVKKVEKANFPQSVAVMAQHSIPYNDSNFKKLMLINHVLGGGMTSRLWKEVRGNRGFAYGVGTGIPYSPAANYWICSLSSDNKNIQKAVDIVTTEWGRLKSGGMTESELEDAKSNLIGSYALNFTSSLKIATLLHTYQIIGYPIDYIDKRSGEIQALTLKDVNEFALKIMDPDGLVTVIVGDPAA